MSMTRRTFVLGSLSACALAAGGLVGCSGGSNGGSDSAASDAPAQESTKTVTADVADGVSVSVDIPESWEADDSSGDGYTTITPSDFGGMVVLGSSINPVSSFTDDQEVLDYWVSTDSDVSGDWKKVDDGTSPIYEAKVISGTGSDGSTGLIRVAICGDYAVACEGLASNGDWKKNAEKEIEDVLSTFSVSKPTAPNYPPKDVFTIVSATHAKDLGYGYWEMHVTVQNNSDSAKNFLGFQIDELDANGNIIQSYMSYNKNAAYAVVEPGQTYTIPLTEADADGIAGMQSRYCEWGDSPSNATKSEYSEVFKTMF